MSSEKKLEASASDSDVGVLSFDDQQLPPSTGHVLGSVEPHVFTNPYRAAHWKETYDAATYEGRHRFDPSWSWSPKEELRLKKKVRRRIAFMSTPTSPDEGVLSPASPCLLTLFVLSCSWTGGLCYGYGSCSPAWISFAATSIALSPTIWYVLS